MTVYRATLSNADFVKAVAPFITEEHARAYAATVDKWLYVHDAIIDQMTAPDGLGIKADCFQVEYTEQKLEQLAKSLPSDGEA